MAKYQIISSRLAGFTPGQIVTDEELALWGVDIGKSLTIATIKIFDDTKTIRKYAKTKEEETEK